MHTSLSRVSVGQLGKELRLREQQQGRQALVAGLASSRSCPSREAGSHGSCSSCSALKVHDGWQT
jgi:hypothetical protein